MANTDDLPLFASRDCYPVKRARNPAIAPTFHLTVWNASMKNPDDSIQAAITGKGAIVFKR
jgi:hypothetical protein